MSSSRRPARVYLAGPFFNQQQIELIKYLEDSFDSWGIPYFSPRKMALNGNPSTTKPTPEQAGAIFKKDYEEICKSTHLLAVLDWTMPPAASLRIVRENFAYPDDNPKYAKSDIDSNPINHPRKYDVVSDHLSLPDSGTVWEMGCAYALRVPVYLYTDKAATRLNLMLTQSALGVIYGREKLNSFLQQDMDESMLEQWKGEHR